MSIVTIEVQPENISPASILTGITQDLVLGTIDYQNPVDGFATLVDTGGIPSISVDADVEVVMPYTIYLEDGSIFLTGTHTFNQVSTAEVAMYPPVFVFHPDQDPEMASLNDGDAITSATDLHSNNVTTDTQGATFVTDGLNGYAGMQVSGGSFSYAQFSAAQTPDMQAALQGQNISYITVAIPMGSGSGTVMAATDGSTRGIRHIASDVQTGARYAGAETVSVGLGNVAISGITVSTDYVGELADVKEEHVKSVLNGSTYRTFNNSYRPTTSDAPVCIGNIIGGGGGGANAIILYAAAYVDMTFEEYFVETQRVAALFDFELEWQKANFPFDGVVVSVGNSITNSIGSQSGAAEDGYAYQKSIIEGMPFGTWQSLGISAANIVELRSVFMREFGWMADFFEKTLIIDLFEFRNSLSNDNAADDMRAFVADIKAHFGTNAFVNLGTAPDVSDSIETPGGAREAYIANIVANPGLADNLWRLDLEPNIGVAGSYEANPELYNDSVHLTGLGAGLAAQDAVTARSGAVIPAYTPPSSPTSITTNATPTINEDQSFSQSVIISNPSGATTLSGVDASLFSITQTAPFILTATPKDFEAPADDGTNNIYNVTITNNGVSVDVALTVNNVAPIITVAGYSNGDTLPSLAVGDTFVRPAVTVTDNATLTYSDPDTSTAGNPVFTVTAVRGVDTVTFDLIQPVTAVVDNTPPVTTITDWPSESIESNSTFSISITTDEPSTFEYAFTDQDLAGASQATIDTVYAAIPAGDKTAVSLNVGTNNVDITAAAPTDRGIIWKNEDLT